VTLFWQVLKPFDRPYSMGLHLLDLHSVSRTSIDSWPGRGNFPTNLWEPGDVFPDTYRVKLPESIEAPFVAVIRPKLADFSPPTPESADYQYRGDLPVTDESGRPVDPVFGAIPVELGSNPQGSGTVAEFASAIRLEGYEIMQGSAPNELQVQLTWRALT